MTLSSLSRLTTEYIEREDRLRISGETSNGTVVIWLTLRLTNRLMPLLLDWLTKQQAGEPYADLLQGWAVRQARAGLEVQAPVRATPASEQWLAEEVTVTRRSEAVILVFKGRDDSQRAQITLAPTPLRQWLAIVHDLYALAGWSRDVWPDWMLDSGPTAPTENIVWH